MSKTDLATRISDAGVQAFRAGNEYDRLLERTFHKAIEAADQLLGDDYSVLSRIQSGNTFAQDNLMARSHPDFPNRVMQKVRRVYWNTGERLIDRLALGILPAGQGKLFRALWLSVEPIDSGLRLYFGEEVNCIDLPKDAWATNKPDIGQQCEMRLRGLLEKGLEDLIRVTSSIESVAWYSFDRLRRFGEVSLEGPHPASPARSPSLTMTSVVWKDID